MKKRTNALSAGSMADVAFLLLVFFLLVTKLPDDAGLLTEMPANDHQSQTPTHERNLLQIHIGQEGEVMLQGEVAGLDEVRAAGEAFYRNGGILDESAPLDDFPHRKWVVLDDEHNDLGERVAHEVFGRYRSLPQVAGIQLNARPFTPYQWYIAVNDELIAARRTVMQEVLDVKGLPSFEEIEGNGRYKQEQLALRVVVPDRVTDVWLDE